MNKQGNAARVQALGLLLNRLPSQAHLNKWEKDGSLPASQTPAVQLQPTVYKCAEGAATHSYPPKCIFLIS